MSDHHTHIAWQRHTPDFTYESYDRNHLVKYGGGTEQRLSGAPEFRGDPALPNPEEMLVAALSSCHMLTFLAVAARKRRVIESYEDGATGVLEKNAAGRYAITRVTLRPRVRFAGADAPSAEELAKLHATAHRDCFIANSANVAMTIEPQD